MVGKQSVLVINMLDAGEIGRNNDLRIFFTRAKLLWQDDWVRMSLKWKGLWVALCQKWWEFTKSGRRIEKPQKATGCWAPKAHRCTRATNWSGKIWM